MTTIRTARLVLRAPAPDDAAAIHELDSDPAVMEFLDPEATPTLEGAQEWIDHLRRTYCGTRGFWIAEEDGRFIGWFHLRPSHDTGECELGYRLRRDAWGRGLATEGSQALLDLAFFEGEPRVVASTDVANVRSRRVMEKLGMVLVREFLYDGRLPSVEYAIERVL